MPGHGAQISARAPTKGSVQTGDSARAPTKGSVQTGDSAWAPTKGSVQGTGDGHQV